MKFTKRAIRKYLSLLLYTIASILILFLWLHFIFPLPSAPEYSTIITDNKNEIIHAYLTRDEKWRMKTEADEISPLLKKTLIEKEDKYFYYHPGVNPFAILRAFTKNIISNRRI